MERPDSTQLLSAGFKRTGSGDTVRCEQCGLEVSIWTSNMNPFHLHREKAPHCPFIQSRTSSRSSNKPLSVETKNDVGNNSKASERENPSKHQKLEGSQIDPSWSTLYEIQMTVQVRRRGFSQWPHRIPSSAQMIEAGFFNCNVGDRVICVYCNLICQQWTPSTDDPCEVHKTISPNCIYVKAKLIRPATSSILIANENGVSATPNSPSPSSSNLEPSRSQEIVFIAACNPVYAELLKRHASFVTWPQENLPSIDDLVRAGFFYTGTKNIVTCFYCNGSLQNWGPNDNPMIEHARWFPHCAYAKLLCGDEMYRKIQESQRAQQERTRANKNRPATTGRQLLAPDERTLSRLVAARLDLSVSQRLLDKNFKLSIIKRCWEDQLRLKQDDFASDIDLYIACLILQKQIEHIDGKKENIVIPSIKMKQIKEQNEIRERQRSAKLKHFTTHTLTMSTSKLLRSIKESFSFIRRLPNFPSTNPTYRRISTLLAACRSNTLLETPAIQDVQRRTFSHWPQGSNLPSASMMDAGFFSCNISDRVICPCCNLICQGWTAGVDDPFEVHRTMSPNCPYIQKKLSNRSNTTRPIINENVIPQTSSNYSSTGDEPDISRFDQIAHTAANNSRYHDLTKRLASFATWPTTNLPVRDDLARAGFFYAGKGTTVHCFYCNGALRNWRPNDNPIAEHVRQFPHCAYAKQVCSDETYQQIRTARCARQENNGTKETREQTHTHYPQLSIPDEDTLTRLVQERLDRPISQCLLNKNFKLSIIKRCWEDQLRLKKSNFHSDDDLVIACLILQKQIEHIDGNKDSIVVPSVRMQQIQEQRTQSTNNRTNTPIQGLASSQSTATSSSGQDRSSATQSDACIICMVEARRLACIPCGHLVACVPCGQSLRTCPMCRREIEAFVRIYVSITIHCKHAERYNSAGDVNDWFIKFWWTKSTETAKLEREISSNSTKTLPLTIKPGIHTSSYLMTVGFQYTGNGDTTRCNDCDLEVSNWTSDMNPWTIHSTQKPECFFVGALRSGLSPAQIALLPRPLTTSSQDNTAGCRNTEIIDYESSSDVSVEADSYRKARESTYSDWLHSSTVSSSAMISAGFVSCNVDDRVICPHCNLTCQRWTPFADVPSEVHKTLSPQCPYVTKILANDAPVCIVNNNQTLNSNSTRNGLSVQATTNSVSLSSQPSPSLHQNTKRNESRSIDAPSTPSIDEAIMTETANPPIQHDQKCVECQKSLQDMSPCYHKTTDIARWLVHCTHSKQLTADQTYDQIQKCKHAQKKRIKQNETSNGSSLVIPSQVLCRDFNLSTLQRIWQKQFRIQVDDSSFDVDLLLSCTIVQKQIDSLDGKQSNIQRPSVRIAEIRQEAENSLRRQMALRLPPGDTSKCIVCWTGQKELACIPCGHQATCILCSQSLRNCPWCQQGIQAFIRVYL